MATVTGRNDVRLGGCLRCLQSPPWERVAQCAVNASRSSQGRSIAPLRASKGLTVLEKRELSNADGVYYVKLSRRLSRDKRRAGGCSQNPPPAPTFSVQAEELLHKHNS